MSAFQSREFGFGLEMSKQDLELVNEYRKDKNYQDGAAAKEKRGDIKKKALTKSPFVFEFEYGANGEGYWVYEHMVLQLEDCIDCFLKVLYPQHEFLFLLDHSCGRDRQRQDGFNAEHMNKLYRGNKPKMRDTKIMQEQGYLGPYDRTLMPGDIQPLTFQLTETGPFWMNPVERERRRHDIIVEGQVSKSKLTKKELSQWLLTCGITMKGRLSDLQKAAINHGIPLEEISQKILEGWEGKPKGLLQVLWERGWIDNSDDKAIQNYTIGRRENEFNLVQSEFSLKHLMAYCTDFKEEEMMLQSMASKMGVSIERSPKCHCEIVGEGIEYSWACAKNHYRQILLDKK